MTASIGVALYPRDGEQPDTLLKNADAAMYGAKDRGRNTYTVYTPGLNEKAHEWLELESALHGAIGRDLVVHYQPKVDVRSGRVVGVEALVRWQHPTLGLLGPDKFIPMAEETGLIAPLGEWVLETACTQAQEWREAGYPPITVAVNLSARQFQLQPVADMVAATLRRTGLPPKFLELELTESLALQGDDATYNTIDELKQMGVTCSVDDFGVGYSNFGYLDTLPIDKIKIDKGFVSKINTSADKPALVLGIIALGRGLGLDVVAEGRRDPRAAGLSRRPRLRPDPGLRVQPASPRRRAVVAADAGARLPGPRSPRAPGAVRFRDAVGRRHGPGAQAQGRCCPGRAGPPAPRLVGAGAGLLSSAQGAARCSVAGSRAMSRTWRTSSARWNVICSRTCSGTSSRSGPLRAGRITSVSPARWAASTFCFTPPIGSTLPCSVTSPVMPTVDRTGRPVSRLTSAVVIVTPADGPSLGTAPAGTCTWKRRCSKPSAGKPSSSACERT